MHTRPAIAPPREPRIRRLLRGALVLAVAGAVAAALLLVDREQEAPRRGAGAAPSGSGDEERPRRRAPSPAWSAPPPAGGPSAPPPRRDSLLAALPVKPDSPVVVFEVNALRHSRLGERLLSCMRGQEQNGFSDVARKTGIDPLKDIDRVAFLGEATVVSGQLEKARWNELGGSGEAYGQGGRIYTTARGAVGTWRDQIAVLSSGPEEVRTAIDQLEGRAPLPEAGLPEELSYGDIYGVVPGAAARQLLGGDGDEGGVTARLAALASRIELQVDAMEDLALKVRVRGEDPGGLADLAKGLGAALTAARASSQLTGNQSLSTLLEKAAVRPGEGELSIELAVPADRVGELFTDCKLFGTPGPAVADPAPRAQAEVVGGAT